MARILIVDDAPLTRQVLAIQLGFAGHEVIGEADNGLDALRLVREMRPDVLLMDMTMPALDGLEVAQRLGSDRPIVVMLSSVTSAARIRQARDAGVDFYVLKPYEPASVIEVLARLLRMRADARVA